MKIPCSKLSLSRSIKRNLVVVAAITAACTLQAQDRPSPRPGESADSKDKGSMFVKAAVEGNSAEIALAEIAARNGQNAELKEFAEHLRKDHTEANKKLEPIAQKHGVTVSQTLDPKHQRVVDRFQQLKGEQFDKEYAKEMLRDHQKAISKYDKASREATDTEIKQYAQETLPKLREHQKHAEKVAKAVGIDAATISSLMRELPEGVGGTSDRDDGTSSDKSDKSTTPKEGADKSQP